MKLLDIIKEIKAIPSINKNFVNIWTVYIGDGRYDNNIWVRAKNEKEAIEIAHSYVDVENREDDEEDELTVNAIRILDDEDILENFKEMLNDPYYKKNNQFQAFIKGKTNGCCYDSGT